MPDLPHGWRMRNSSVELHGPPVEREDSASFSGDDVEHDLAEPLDIRPDSEGWEDLEEDTETISAKCLFCDENFPAVTAMVTHSKSEHKFDLPTVQQSLKLDFYSTIKLVNYIRSEVAAGKKPSSFDDSAAWADDKYLQPVIQDDSLLFELDDIEGIMFAQEDAAAEPS